LSKTLFANLKSAEARGKQRITVSLSFTEYEPRVAKVQERKEAVAQAERAEEPRATTPVVPDKTRRGLNKMEDKYAQYDTSGRHI
jgi:DNA repair photolyase